MRPARAGAVLLAVGAVGLVASAVVAVTGLRLVDRLGSTLHQGADVAARTVTVARSSLADAESSVRELEAVLEEAEGLLAATADLSEDEVAASVAAVNDTLPALIEVAAVIDRTLSALASVPFGPDYDPEEPFDTSLRRLERELSGLPEELRAQAGLIRGAGGNLGAARSGVLALADDLAALQGTLSSAQRLTDGLAAEDAGQAPAEDLDASLGLARRLVLALAATAAAAHIAPLFLGWVLLRRDPPPWLAALSRAPARREPPPPPV